MTNLAAVIATSKAQVVLTKRPIPTPGPNELLIRNHAIAANPVDWKIQSYGLAFINTYPTVLGSDVSGIVSAVGSSVTRFKVGDRVTGFAGVIYNNDINHGAWQTYTLVPDISAAKIPSTMSFEEGSVFPMAIATAAVGLFLNLGIPRPPAYIPNVEKEAILVWGGSSSVGSAAVQIAKTLGFTVFSTASLANLEYVKSLGATEAFDYRDLNVVSNISAAAKNAGVAITKIFDAVSEKSSLQHDVQVLSENGKGRGAMALVLFWGDEPKPDGVDISTVMASSIATSASEFGAWLFNEWLEEALEQNIMPAPKIQVVEGGIGATQKVFDLLKAGVSAKKLVVKVE